MSLHLKGELVGFLLCFHSKAPKMKPRMTEAVGGSTIRSSWNSLIGHHYFLSSYGAHYGPCHRWGWWDASVNTPKVNFLHIPAVSPIPAAVTTLAIPPISATLTIPTIPHIPATIAISAICPIPPTTATPVISHIHVTLSICATVDFFFSPFKRENTRCIYMNTKVATTS